MKVLVTGAAGFLGSRVIRALLSRSEGRPVTRIVAADTSTCAIDDRRVQSRTGTITDDAFTRSILDSEVDVVYHLAAVLSGEAEAEFDLGMKVNVEATRGLLEACRGLPQAPRFVFTSSLAVFGGPLPDVLPEDMAVRPQRRVSKWNYGGQWTQVTRIARSRSCSVIRTWSISKIPPTAGPFCTSRRRCSCHEWSRGWWTVARTSIPERKTGPRPWT